MGVLQLSAFEGGRIQFSLEYHDGNRRLTHLTCENRSTRDAQGTLIDPATHLLVGQGVFLAGTTTRLPLVTTLTVAEDAEGNVDHPCDVRLSVLALPA